MKIILSLGTCPFAYRGWYTIRMRFPQDFCERRQLHDACHTRSLPLCVKGPDTETRLYYGNLKVE